MTEHHPAHSSSVLVSISCDLINIQCVRLCIISGVDECVRLCIISGVDNVILCIISGVDDVRLCIKVVWIMSDCVL